MFNDLNQKRTSSVYIYIYRLLGGVGTFCRYWSSPSSGQFFCATRGALSVGPSDDRRARLSNFGCCLKFGFFHSILVEVTKFIPHFLIPIPALLVVCDLHVPLHSRRRPRLSTRDRDPPGIPSPPRGSHGVLRSCRRR